MKKPDVSVIIAAYNAQKHIEECLLSLNRQSFKNFEVIVVDDGSIDKTSQIASKYAKVIRTHRNSGQGRARNLGVKESRAEIIAFTDADVVLPEDWLFRIITNMRIHNVKCTGGGYCGMLNDSFIEKFAFLELRYRRKNLPLFVNTLVSNNFACYKDIFFECGGFPQDFKCEDLRFSFKISRKYPIFWDSENGVFHHFRDSWRSYLSQQFCFAKDTVWVYCKYPETLLHKTHQGRKIYLETLLMFFALLGVVLLPVSVFLFLFLILTLNFSFLKFLKNNNLSIILSVLLILLRDIVCVVGVFLGIGMCFVESLKRKRQDVTAKPPKH